MKKAIVLAMSVIAFLTLPAQQKKWKEMSDFHGVMSATFHPSEDNNLQPLKDSASVLVSRAKAWQHSTVPEGFNEGATAPVLKKLVEKCEAIRKAVSKNKPDGELKKMITEAHETFHEIMEKCRE